MHSDMKRIALHEAGHAVVAVHEGFRTPIIRIGARGADTVTQPDLPGASLSVYMRSRLRVLLAGAVAQCLMLCPEDGDGLARAFDGPDASSDWAKACEIMSLLIHEQTGGEGSERGYGVMIDAIKEEVAGEIRRILEANRAILDELADLTVCAFDDMLEIGGPEGDTTLYVDSIAVEDVLRGVVKTTFSPV